MGLLQKLFGTHSENELKRIYPIVDRIEALEPEMQKLSDAELRDKTDGERGVCQSTWHASFPCTVSRRCRSSSGTYR